MQTVLKELVETNTVSVQDKFYRQFSSLDCTICQDIDQVIAKVWELIGRNIISKSTLYLYLLSKSNAILLERCISRDKIALSLNLIHDPQALFDYTVYTGKHWFLELVTNRNSLALNQLLTEPLYQKLLYLKAVHMTNDSAGAFHRELLEQTIRDCTNSAVDKFWIYYTKEIDHLLKLLKYFEGKCSSGINERDFLTDASQKSILELAANYLKIDTLEQAFAQFEISDMPHKEDLANQKEIFACYALLIDFLKLLLPGHPYIEICNLTRHIKCKFMQLESSCLQTELLQVMFACIFLKKNHFKDCQDDTYICHSKEVQAVLYTIRALIGGLAYKKPSEKDTDNGSHLQVMHKIVTDATWRLDLVSNVVNPKKSDEKLLHYMQADPESLINLCLKQEDFERAFQVLKIFDMMSTPLAKEIVYTEQLQDLKEALQQTLKVHRIGENSSDSSWINVPNMQLELDEISKEFFQNNPPPQLEEGSSPDNAMFMNILDLAITQAPSKVLFQLAFQFYPLEQVETPFTLFSKRLHQLCNEADSMTLIDLNFDWEEHKRGEAFYATLENIYTDLCEALLQDDPGVLNKDHPSHQLIQQLNKHCSDYLQMQLNPEDFASYLQKLWNYLRAFARVLYIEKDCSGLVAEGKNASYFRLLSHNRSELMGNLLFQQNLNPAEFEKYFGKLKLDFLYHVVGNCFPTINLHAAANVAQEELYHENVLYPPNSTIISYIKKRNWLLALILIEMYRVENVEFDVGELRIRNFLNYLHLPKILHLQPLFNGNEIITALQNEISFQKVHDHVQSEIGKNFTYSSQSNQSVHSLETAQEIEEDQLNNTNWKRLANMLDSIPEKQLRNGEFRALKDMILVNLVKDGFECDYYKFAMEVSDRETRIDLLMENLKTWPEDFCIRSIQTEISWFDQEDDVRVAELKAWLKHIEQSKQVMEVLNVTNWGSLYELCTFQPKSVIQKLLESKQLVLLIEFLQMHEVSEEMLLCIDEHFLERSFDLDVDFASIKRLLMFLPPERSIALCQNLLSLLKDVQHLQAVTNYLIRSTQDNTLRKVALSLKMLSVFQESELDQQLLILLKDPMSIIEVLIMNTKLDKLGEVLELIQASEEVVSTADVDEMLRSYAEKSLDFRVIAQPNPRLLRTPEHSLLQSLDSIQFGSQAAAFAMPEEVPTRDDWVANSEVIECMCCRNECFSMFNRRHHCRRCGRVICYSCSQKRMIVPTYGDILVRVCIQCYQQTFADSSLGDDTMSSRSCLNDYWMLTGDPEHNRIVKREFSYEFAPSVSLCLALMKFHSKSDTYSKFLLNQCDLLLKLLVPNQEPIQEIDYMLVIRMLKSLALAAKMAAQDSNSPQLSASSADQFLTQAELLGLLAERGCLNLLPSSGSSCFVDSSALMRFIEKLLEREQWTLALEVSTKAGIDKSGVFAAWGKSCLKAGDLASAREKFSKSYDISSLKGVKNPSKLNEIIKILESKTDPIDDELLANHRKLLGVGQAIPQAERAVFILSKLKNLKNITCGNYATGKDRLAGRQPKLHDSIYQECVYYLDKYGTAYNLVEFHIKYGHFAKALDSMIKKRLSGDEFVDVYMRCLEIGSVTVLQAQMSEMDPSLAMWKDYLVKICRHLTKQNLLHSLHQLQQYMGDYVRAAMTCIKFYEEKATSFIDLLQRNHLLIDALRHLAHGREQDQWVAVSPVETGDSGDTFEETSIVSSLIKQMSPEEIQKHSATIQMQIEVTQFLAGCEARGVFPMQVFLEIFSNPDQIPRKKIPVPTLFGPEEQRKYVAVLCFICAEDIGQGFGFGSCIINEFKQLKPLRVYKETVKYFANTRKIDDIANLVFHVKNTSQDATIHEVCDEVLIFAIAVLKRTDTSEAQIEELIKLIADKSSKISAYIEAKQLKKAYFLATKHKKAVDLKKILWEAEHTNQTLLKDLCKKAIQHLEKESGSKA